MYRVELLVDEDPGDKLTTDAWMQSRRVAEGKISKGVVFEMTL